MEIRWRLFWKRVGAYLIDVVFLSFLVVKPLTAGYQAPIEVGTLTDFISSMAFLWSKDFLLLTFLVSFLTLVYWSVLEWRLGQSVGKILLHLRVKSVRKGPVTFGQALVRNVTKISSLLLFLDVLYLLFTKKGTQRYAEVLSRTTVVEEASHL